MPFVKFWGPVVSKGSLFHEKATVEMHVRLPLIISTASGALGVVPFSDIYTYISQPIPGDSSESSVAV